MSSLRVLLLGAWGSRVPVSPGALLGFSRPHGVCVCGRPRGCLGLFPFHKMLESLCLESS